MKNHTTTWNYICCLLLLITSGLSLPLAAATDADDLDKRHFVFDGIAVTGFNELCGEAVQSLPLPAPLPSTFHGAFLGEFDELPEATEAIPLTLASCEDKNILLASTTDDNFLDTFGIPNVDDRLKNIPLRDVPTILTLDGIRSAIPAQGILPPDPLPPTKSEPNDPISLGGWLKASGKMQISCKENGSALVSMQLKNLVPNGLYSVLAITRTIPPGSNTETAIALPFGGVPNNIVASDKGSAIFKRKLASCPMDPTPNGSQILFIDVAFHSDNNVYGAVPAPALQTVNFLNPDGSTYSSILGFGTVIHAHLDFFITGDPVIFTE